MNAYKTELHAIQSLRALYLQEMNAQVRYNACHERGRADSYLITDNGRQVGYGSVNGQDQKDRDTVFEFYIIPHYRMLTKDAFGGLLAMSGATFIECQSNDPFLTPLLHAFAENIEAPVILFKDREVTHLLAPRVIFRPKTVEDEVFEHKVEPKGEFVLEKEGEVIATGGFLLHYNKPFADPYMEVKEEHRRQGFGSFLIQEVRKECYLAGRVPAARCDAQNTASKATLLKGGMAIAGEMLIGEIKGK